MALLDTRGLNYLLAVLAASAAFLLYVGIQFSGEITALKSLLLASALAAAGAAVFAFLWPARSWRWGLLLSSAFWVYLALVFAAFVAGGELEWWPLVDALVIALIACGGAALGRVVSRRSPA